MKILIVEDEAIIAEGIYQVLIQLGYDPYEPTGSKEEALQFLADEKPDVAIVDIHAGEQFSGFKVAEQLNKLNIPYLFLTALYEKEVIATSQQFSPSAYLVKPYVKENLFATIELICSKSFQAAKKSKETYQPVFIKSGNQSTLVQPEEILFLEAEGKYVKIQMMSAKKHLVRGTLSEIMDQLNMQSMVQIHKSFIVNLNQIRSIQTNEILVGEINLPVGRSYKENFQQRIRKL